MDVNEFLKKPSNIKKKIRYLNLELDRYTVMMNSIRQPKYDAVRVDKSPSKDTPNQLALEKYYETKDKISEKEKELKEASAEISKVADMLEKDDSKLVIKYKYIDGLTWDEISKKLFLSCSTIRRLNRDAKESIDWLIN